VTRAPVPDKRCRICTRPLISVGDDPHDPGGHTHPSCDPVDAEAWERFLHRHERTNDR
jgi:hypothetical protein